VTVHGKTNHIALDTVSDLINIIEIDAAIFGIVVIIVMLYDTAKNHVQPGNIRLRLS
jgi:hypothetical protein